jgi:hypothetical protein
MRRHRRAALRSLLVFLGLGLTCPSLARAAKVIMKDGKIIEGKIVAETNGDVLIRTPPVNPMPILLPARAILTIIRDPVPEKPYDPQRYVSLETLLEGNVFTANNMTLDPGASLRIGGGLRIHPLVEIGGGFIWKPALSGALAVTDGKTTRGYERFYSYGGGFTAKLFPCYRIRRWTTEPFLIVGYEWTQLVPKASGDGVDGRGLEGGFGVQRPLTKKLFLVAQFLYRGTGLDTIDFQGLRGTLDPEIHVNSYTFSTGLAFHF